MQRRGLKWLVASSAILTAALGLPALPASATTPAWVDTSYGVGGASVVPNATFGVTIVDPSGRALVLGLTNGNGSGGQVTRLNVNGAVDKTFGTMGTVTLPASSLFYTRLALDSSGLIYALGSNAPFGATSTSFDVTRLTSAGAVDSMFGTSGTASVALPQGNPAFVSDSFTVRPDGEVAVSLTTTDSTNQGYLAALTPSGALDTNVNASGTNPGFVSLPAKDFAFDLTASPAPAAPVFTADTPPANAYMNAPYTYTFAATGVPAASFTVSMGTLPDGLTLTPAGVLSGTPTTQGVSTFTVTASNGVTPDAVSPSITITVNPPLASPMFTADSPPATAVVGTAYTYTFAANGEPAPTFSVSSGALPAGLTLNGTSGVLSGTPTAAGSFTFTVTAANGVTPNAVSPSLSISVNSAPKFTADTPPKGNLGRQYSYTFTASGRPAPSFSVKSGALPDGLTLSSAGVLSGVPTKAGTFTFTVQAANGVGTNAVTPTITLKITANPVAPKFLADNPPGTATVGTPYSYTFQAIGHPNPTYKVLGVLPPGLSLNATSGVLSGTPTRASTYSFRVEAVNGVSPVAISGPLKIVVSAAGAASPAAGPAPAPAAVAQGTASPAAADTAVGPDQNTVMSILADNNAPIRTYALQRYLSNLTLDPSFGTGGTSAIFPSGVVPEFVAEASDATYYVTGKDGQSVFVAHFLSNGALDTTYGTGGIVTTPADACSPAGGLLSFAGASIYVIALNTVNNATCSPSPALLFRFKNGALDTSFGSGGEVKVDSVAAMRVTGANGGGVQPNGEVLIGVNGSAAPTPFSAGVVQVNSSGAGPTVQSFTQLVDDSHFAALTVAPNGGGNTYAGPVAATVDGGGTTHLFVQGKNNHLIEFNQTASGWSGAVDITALVTSGPLLASAPQAVFDGTNLDVFALATGGHLIQYKGKATTWTATDINAAAGSGSPAITASIDPLVIGGVARMYAMTSAGDLVEVDNDNAGGHAWNFYDLTTSAGAGASIAGGPAAILLGTIPHVYTRAASNNHLLEFVADGLNGHTWNAYDTTASAPGAPAIAGNPDPTVINSVPHVYVAAATSGDLVEFVADNLGGSVWNAYDQTTGGGAPKPVGSPSVVLIDGMPYGIGQPVPEVWETPASGDLTAVVADHLGGNNWNTYDVTALSGGPQVTGLPTPIVVPAGPHSTTVAVFALGLGASGAAAAASPSSSGLGVTAPAAPPAGSLLPAGG